MIIRNRTISEARRAAKNTGRGATPVIRYRNSNPDGVTERFCRPFRADVCTSFLQGLPPCLYSGRPFGA